MVGAVGCPVSRDMESVATIWSLKGDLVSQARGHSGYNLVINRSAVVMDLVWFYLLTTYSTNLASVTEMNYSLAAHTPHC